MSLWNAVIFGRAWCYDICIIYSAPVGGAGYCDQPVWLVTSELWTTLRAAWQRWLSDVRRFRVWQKRRDTACIHTTTLNPRWLDSTALTTKSLNSLKRQGVRRCLSVSVSVCLSVCLPASISLEPLDRSSHEFVCGDSLVVARSSSGGVALRYVLPVLWMTSCLAVWPPYGDTWLAVLRYRGGVWCLWMPCWLLWLLLLDLLSGWLEDASLATCIYN